MKIKVGTFCDKGETRVSKIQAYTLTYNVSWTGGKEYEVEAKNGTEAKKIAKQLRLEDERGAK